LEGGRLEDGRLRGIETRRIGSNGVVLYN
jgi:hypothetical protein